MSGFGCKVASFPLFGRGDFAGRRLAAFLDGTVGAKDKPGFVKKAEEAQTADRFEFEDSIAAGEMLKSRFVAKAAPPRHGFEQSSQPFDFLRVILPLGLEKIESRADKIALGCAFADGQDLVNIVTAFAELFGDYRHG